VESGTGEVVVDKREVPSIHGIYEVPSFVNGDYNNTNLIDILREVSGHECANASWVLKCYIIFE
jgi:hypothetical protein